ncbi:MAG: hypothetical protein QXS23_04095 [Desulfurococcaceae archaeon]
MGIDDLNNIEKAVEMLKKYNELSSDEMNDLYDILDTLFNEIRSKYLDILWNPGENIELFNQLLDLAITLLGKRERSLQEDLVLIALLDLFATDLHDKIFGFVEETEGT